MKVERSEKIRAGLFVLVSITLLVVIVFLVAGLRVFKSTKTHIVRFKESVTGLEVSSIVRYRGVPIGRVASIDFSPDGFPMIDVTVEVRPDAPVMRDTKATLKPQGITGLYYIDLDEGTVEAEPLADGGVIIADDSTLFKLVQSLERMGGLVEDVSRIAKSMDRLISANEGEIGSALKGMTAATEDSRKFLKQMMEFMGEARTDLTTTIRNANGTLTAIRTFAEAEEFQAIPGRVSLLFDETQKLTASLDRQITATDSAVREFRRNLSANSGVLLRAMNDLREFAQNLKGLSREVRDQPSRLFFDSPKSQGGRDR